MGNQHQPIGSPVYGFCADADNLGLCGQRGRTDLVRFVTWLRRDRHLDSAHSVVCANWLRPMERALLGGMGFRTVEAGVNCDDLVAREIIRLVKDEGVNILTVAAGDGGYLNVLARLRRVHPLRIHIIANRHTLSRRLGLAGLADGITYFDSFRDRRISRRPQKLAA